MTKELIEYVRKRDQVLISLNLNEARKLFPSLEHKSDDFVLLTLHKARYECVNIPREYRSKSGAWLISNGYTRMNGTPVNLFHDLAYVH